MVQRLPVLVVVGGWVVRDDWADEPQRGDDSFDGSNLGTQQGNSRRGVHLLQM
jgi:hypothetical protein